VLGLFREAGLVVSRPGVGGGWRLAVDPAQITLADVWRVIHGDGDVLGLRSAHPECPVGQSIQGLLAAIDRDAARAVEDRLRDTTIAQLVSQAVAGADLRSLV
jgi:DNA-binding IscR family transcriptional regulator